MLKSAFIAFLSLATCGLAGAASLTVTETGTFSSTDTADSFVTPGGTFSLSFQVNSTNTISSANSTSVSFDVPVSNVAYSVNGLAASVGQPNEITFYTSADGGGNAVQFANTEFIFGSSQLFTGTTTAPSFAAGSFIGQNFSFLDNSNVDSGNATVTVAAVPEPSSLLLLCGGLGLFAVGIKTSARVR